MPIPLLLLTMFVGGAAPIAAASATRQAWPLFLIWAVYGAALLLVRDGSAATASVDPESERE